MNIPKDYDLDKVYELFASGMDPEMVAEEIGVDVKKMRQFYNNHRSRILRSRKPAEVEDKEAEPEIPRRSVFTDPTEDIIADSSREETLLRLILALIEDSDDDRLKRTVRTVSEAL